MKTYLILFVLTTFLFATPVQNRHESSTTHSVHSSFSQPAQKDNIQKQKKKKKKRKSKAKRGYKVISHAPTLIYTVIKVGNGNRVMFCMRNGMGVLPNALSFSQSSGVRYNFENKQGFENVDFPFTCKLSCPVSYRTNYTNQPPMINDFQIIITEPGDWVVSFNN